MSQAGWARDRTFGAAARSPGRKPQPPNPPTSKWHELRDSGERYMTMHQVVGTLPAGVIVSAKALGPSADIEHLIRNSAIRVVSDAELQAFEDQGGQVVHEPGFTVAQPLNPLLQAQLTSGTGRPPGEAPGTPGGPPVPAGENQPNLRAQAGEDPAAVDPANVPVPGPANQPDPIGTAEGAPPPPPPASGSEKPIEPVEQVEKRRAGRSSG